MAVYRVHKSDNYTSIANSCINDRRLSYKARGILIYLLSKPPHWEPKVNDIENNSLDGKTSVYSGLKELKQHGYVVAKQLRKNGRCIGHEYHIFETPQQSVETSDSQDTEHAQRDHDNTDLVLLDSENLNLENNDEIINNEYKKKKRLRKERAVAKTPEQEVDVDISSCLEEPVSAALSRNNNSPNNSIIGEKLTLCQIQAVKKKLSHVELNPGEASSTLQHAVLTSLLDESQFKGCGQDFAKKLNTIAKCFKEGVWSPQAVLATQDLKQAEREEKAVNDEVSELNFKYRTLRGDIAHFEEFLKQNLNPDDLSDALPLYAEKQRELERIKAKLHGLKSDQAQKKTNLTHSPSGPQVKYQTQRISTELYTEPVDNLPGDVRGELSNRKGCKHDA